MKASAARAVGYDEPTTPDPALLDLYRKTYERYRAFVAAHLPLYA